MRKRTLPIIHIIGLPGVGKTTLARRLSEVFKIPILRIGCYRARFPQTPIGEASAWVELFKKLSQRRWKNCILETTGLNFREAFLKEALPFENIFTIKLEASLSTLFERIGRKRKKDQGGKWLYGEAYQDKYEFVRKLFKRFREIPANCCINTDTLSSSAVCRRVLKEINGSFVNRVIKTTYLWRKVIFLKG